MDSNWVHGLTGKFHNHRPYSKRAGAKPIPHVGRPSTSIPRLPIQQRPHRVPPHHQNFHQNTRLPPLPQLTIRRNFARPPQLTEKKTTKAPPSLKPPPPPLPQDEEDQQEINPLEINLPSDNLDADDSLSNQLVNFLNPDIEIKSEPNSDHDADYMDD